jgi:pyruvate/2-oxoglutarate dehydrogenase complex dihydrolipoamide acyltransferase (E2) component
MATEVRLPQFGLTMESARVVHWLKGNGDQVRKGEPLVELENDKAIVPFESPESGFLKIIAGEGVELQVGGLLALIQESSPG